MTYLCIIRIFGGGFKRATSLLAQSNITITYMYTSWLSHRVFISILLGANCILLQEQGWDGRRVCNIYIYNTTIRKNRVHQSPVTAPKMSRFPA